MSGSEIWLFARRWIWLVLLGAIVGAAAGYVVSAQQPRVYAASAKLLVTAGDSSVLTGGGGDLTPDQVVATYAQVLQSRPVVAAAFAQSSVAATYENAVRDFDVSPIRGTQIIVLTVRAVDPATAAELANQLAVAAVQQARAAAAGQLAARRTQVADNVNQIAAQVAIRAQQLDALQARPPGTVNDGDVAAGQAALADAQQRYAAAVRSVGEQDLAAARTGDALRTADPAVAPAVPISPRVSVNVALGALLGLLLALVPAMLLEVAGDRLPTPEAAQRRTGLPIWGVVPRGLSKTGWPVSAPGTAAEHSLIEAFRALRTSVQRIVARTPVALLVASSSPDEGTATTDAATGLAIAWAHAGERVVLVDADVHAPRLGSLFGVQSNPDLLDLLVNEPTPELLSGALRATRFDQLQVLTCAPKQGAADLVVSRRMERLIEALCALADRVIVVSAPISAGETLAATLSVDAAVLVVDAGHSRGRDARRSADAMRSAGRFLNGVVFTTAPS